MTNTQTRQESTTDIIKAMIEQRMAEVQQRQLENAENKRRELEVIEAFNEDPGRFTKDQQMRIAYTANSYGVNTRGAAQNDEPTSYDKWKAGIGGAVDSLLFGILKNDWYTDERTEQYANIGRIAGAVAGLAIPGSAFGTVGKVLLGGSKGLKTMGGLLGIGNAAKVWKVAKGVDAGADTVNAVKAINSMGGLAKTTSALKNVKTLRSAAVAAAAAAKAADNTQDLINAATAAAKALDASLDAKQLMGVTGAAKAVDAISSADKFMDAFETAKSLNQVGKQVSLGKVAGLVAQDPVSHAKTAMHLQHLLRQKFDLSNPIPTSQEPDYADYRKVLEYMQMYYGLGGLGNSDQTMPIQGGAY